MLTDQFCHYSKLQHLYVLLQKNIYFVRNTIAGFLNETFRIYIKSSRKFVKIVL